MAVARAAVVVLLLVLLPVAAAPADAQQVVGSPEVSLFSPHNELTPGQETTLSVYVSNAGRVQRAGPADYVDRVTTARGLTLEALDGGAPITVTTGRYPVGSVPVGTTGPIPLSVTVPADARPGTYELPVRVQYSYTTIVDYSGSPPTYNDGFENRIFDLEITIRDRPRFAVVNASTTTRVGGRGTTTLTLRNVGTEPARDATVELASESEAVQLGTRSTRARAFASAWAPGTDRTFTFATTATADAVVREYPLTAVVTYQDTDGIQRTSPALTAGVTLRQEQTFRLGDLESSLYVGEPGTVRGTVTNTGPIAVDDAVLVLAPTSPSIAAVDGEASLGRLAVGERRSFTLDVDVGENAPTGDRQLNVTVRYRDGQGHRQSSRSIAPTVRIQPERTWLAVTPEQTTVRIDSDNRLTVRLHNTEAVPLTDLRARIATEPPFTTKSSLAYVSRLDPGEDAVVAFEVTVAEDAVPTQSSVGLNVTAKRPDGKEIALDPFVVPVTVTPDTGASDTTLLAGGVLVALVLLGAGWWWLRQ